MKKKQKHLVILLKKNKQEILKTIKKETGLDIDIWAADSIQPLLDHQKDYRL